MTDHLTSAAVSDLTTARHRAQRAEIELRAAQADLDLALLNIQEAYGISPGDKLTPDGAITRAASTLAPTEGD